MEILLEYNFPFNMMAQFDQEIIGNDYWLIGLSIF
jgi:hypothetical protein